MHIPRHLARKLLASVLLIVLCMQPLSGFSEESREEDPALYGTWGWSGGDLLEMFTDFGFPSGVSQTCTFSFYPGGTVVVTVPAYNLGSAQGTWFTQGNILYVIEQETDTPLGGRYEIAGDILQIYSNDGYVTSFTLQHRMDKGDQLYTYRVLADGTAEITGYEFGSSSLSYELHVPSCIDGYTVTVIGDNAFKSAYNLTSVSLPETVTSVGSQAFANCIKLRNIQLPSSLLAIGEKAFYYCTSLQTIRLPSALRQIGSKAFEYCLKLKYVNLPDNVEVGAEAFASCTSMSQVTIGRNMAQIPDGMLSGCTSLNSVSLSASLQHIGSRAFYNCIALTRVDMNDQLRSIGSEAFANCTALTSARLNPGLESIGDKAFANCFALTDVGGPTPWYIDDSAWLPNVMARKDSTLRKLTEKILDDSEASTFRIFSDSIVTSVEKGDASIVSREVYEWLTDPATQFVGAFQDKPRRLTQDIIKSVIMAEVENLSFSEVTTVLKNYADMASVVQLDAEAYKELFQLLESQGLSGGNLNFASMADAAGSTSGISEAAGNILSVLGSISEIAMTNCQSRAEWEQMVMYAAMEGTSSRYLQALRRASTGMVYDAADGVEGELKLAVRSAFLSCLNTGGGKIGEVVLEMDMLLAGVVGAKNLFGTVVNAWTMGGSIGSLLTESTGDMIVAHDEMYYLNLISRQIEKDVEYALDTGLTTGLPELMQLYCAVQAVGHARIQDYNSSYSSTLVAQIRSLMGNQDTRQINRSMQADQQLLQEQQAQLNAMIATYRSSALPDTLKTLGDGAFANCTSLTAVLLPASIDSIGSGCFTGCMNLSIAAPVNAWRVIRTLEDNPNFIVLGESR